MARARPAPRPRAPCRPRSGRQGTAEASRPPSRTGLAVASSVARVIRRTRPSVPRRSAFDSRRRHCVGQICPPAGCPAGFRPTPKPERATAPRPAPARRLAIRSGKRAAGFPVTVASMWKRLRAGRAAPAHPLRRHDKCRTNSCLLIARPSRDRAKAHLCPASFAGAADGRATTKGGVPCARTFKPRPAGCAALAGPFWTRQPGCTGQDVRFAPSRIHPLPADQGPANRGAQDRHRVTPAERGDATKARHPPRSRGLPRNPAAATVATERGPRRAARSTGRAAPR